MFYVLLSTSVEGVGQYVSSTGVHGPESSNVSSYLAGCFGAFCSRFLCLSSVVDPF